MKSLVESEARVMTWREDEGEVVEVQGKDKAEWFCQKYKAKLEQDALRR